ncbi:MAG: hypothetical protein K8953_11760 [Proteobacteria bacterium]|nr:hypothetical protein [Pseudomonadota bacterium]
MVDYKKCTTCGKAEAHPLYDDDICKFCYAVERAGELGWAVGECVTCNKGEDNVGTAIDHRSLCERCAAFEDAPRMRGEHLNLVTRTMLDHIIGYAVMYGRVQDPHPQPMILEMEGRDIASYRRVVLTNEGRPVDFQMSLSYGYLDPYDNHISLMVRFHQKCVSNGRYESVEQLLDEMHNEIIDILLLTDKIVEPHDDYQNHVEREYIIPEEM